MRECREFVAGTDYLNTELAEAGELVAVHGLAFPDQARLVWAGNERITDGVFR